MGRQAATGTLWLRGHSGHHAAPLATLRGTMLPGHSLWGHGLWHWWAVPAGTAGTVRGYHRGVNVSDALHASSGLAPSVPTPGPLLVSDLLPTAEATVMGGPALL